MKKSVQVIKTELAKDPAPIVADNVATAAAPKSEFERLNWNLKNAEEYRQRLLVNLKAAQAELEKLLAEADDHWGCEDSMYRFYHQSFKVYSLQARTTRIAAVLQTLLPDRAMNEWFREIVSEGTGKTFDISHNEDWLCHTRPIVEAYFHAHFFLRMACKYGRELDEMPNPMPSGWAALLYLYDLR